MSLDHPGRRHQALRASSASAGNVFPRRVRRDYVQVMKSRFSAGNENYFRPMAASEGWNSELKARSSEDRTAQEGRSTRDARGPNSAHLRLILSRAELARTSRSGAFN